MKNQTQININLSEKELEDFLCSNNNLEKYLGLKFIARQVSIPPVGIIDILAYHKESKCWVVIELKKDLLDASAFCQLSSYLNYYKKTKSFINYKYFQRERKFCGLLIGSNLDENLYKCVNLYNSYNEYIDDSLINYCLFSATSENEIEFIWYNSDQQNIENSLVEIVYKNDFNRHNALEGLCNKDL